MEKQTDFCQTKLLSLTSKSKEEFIKEYKKYDKKSAKDLYLQVLNELEKAISEDKMDRLKKLSNLIAYISEIEDRLTLRDYYDTSNNPIKSTNLVILTCKHNKIKILEYQFNNDSKILNNLSVDIGRNTILPNDEDETLHNAFYYAIRSGNVELIDTLISKWPDNYFAVYSDELDEILSIAYEELKLKNVPLSEEMEIFVENKLIDLRFFSNTSRQDQNVQVCLNKIRERIVLVLQNISMLKTEYSNTKKVDEKFLFIAKSIAQNIHILKRVKSTYDRLPWEEMEFCLVSFVSCYIKRQEINLFYNAILNKSKILNHLENFAKKLEEEIDIIEGINIDKLTILPKLQREKVVAQIISSYPQFEELYNDYQQIRDIHSLQKISDHIKLAVSSDPKEREGRLIITRVLQFIGEHLKNTLESPKLSNTISEHLLLSLPKDTRKIIIDLRNSLSHAYSLSKRTEIEENTDISYFTGVQNDIKRVGDVITDIFYSNKIKTIKILLKKIINSESLHEIKEVVADISSNIELETIIARNLQMMEHEKLEKLIKELSVNVTDKTNHEKELFNKINNMINCLGPQLKNVRTHYITGFKLLVRLSINILNDYNLDENVRKIKFRANEILENIVPQIEIYSFLEIARLSVKIFDSIRSRIQHDNLNEIKRLCYDIGYIALYGLGDVKWLEELREKLNEKDSFISTRKHRKTYNITEEQYDEQLALKLSELKSILNNNSLGDRLIEKLSSYKSNKKLQAVVEMIVLDIMSIFGSPKFKTLENNLFFLDENTPLLTGKCLRNHLAHDNVVVDVLLSDPLKAVILNAKKLTEENITKSKKKIGKLATDDISKVREKYNKGLDIIINQERMFVALEEGNLESLMDCLKKGTDINARSINLWTALHFAAQGHSLEVIKFILNQNLNFNVKDINGQSPLHIATAHGRKNIVEFLVKNGSKIDDLDNNDKTPLHIAAQNGHLDIVVVLLKNKANAVTQDIDGLLPLHYAIRNNHIDVVKILLEKDANAINETVSWIPPLQEATESGHLELINLLLQNKADVNARTDKNRTPLHAAAFNGNLEVMNALILKGANVNAEDIHGCTPLYYAVEDGHEEIVNILLKHRANVNVVDKTNNNTPLHLAAKYGHEGIVKTLLRNKANANVTTVNGVTPLHFAVSGGHLGIVNVLLKHGVNIHAKAKNNSTSLHCAAKCGYKEVAEFLIKSGAEIDAEDDNNFTPLYMAAQNGHKDIIKLLIQNKARINAEDIKGNTVLHVAVKNGSKDVIDLLIKNKAEVNARNNDRVTPLHEAAMTGSTDVINLLINNKAEVNARTNNGITPLHDAVSNENKNAIHLLIKNKAEVNGRNKNDFTPLHVAVITGNKDIIDFLIKNKAEVNAKTNSGVTPLHGAILGRYKDIVNTLVNHKAEVNTRDEDGTTPLHTAVKEGHKGIIQILIANGARVNVKNNDNHTPLLYAIKYNHKEIVEALLTSGADVNVEGGKALSVAVLAGYNDIVDILLKHNACINTKGYQNVTLLHLAAKIDDPRIMNALIKRGGDINAIINTVALTPLHVAAEAGHEKIVEVLIENGANIYVKSNGVTTPLHLAIIKGHSKVVKVLLDNEANINDENRTLLELAVTHGHLQVVKMLLQNKKVDINDKNNNGWTILHVASNESNLEMVKYLVNNGSDINARSAFGVKSIHIAATGGFKDTVEFFLSKGSSISDLDAENQTLLHYAARKDRLEVVKYLIEQGANINAKDVNGLSPLHIAANFSYKKVIEVLLNNGAVYNVVDNNNRKPLEMACNKDIINLLVLTEKLFEAVKRNSPSEVKNYIEAGAVVNVKNTDGGTPLHYAAWKGYDGVVNILLQNKANPNAIGNKGATPLHYAAKFSHLQVVKALLSNGGIYNAVSDNGKTPSDFAVNKSIASLFMLVSESFKNIKNGNFEVIDDLNRIKNMDIIKAIINARNRENKTLVVAAMHSNFSKVEQLKQILQGDVSTQINTALILKNQGNYQGALSIFKNVFEKRKEVLGPDNPGTLDIQTYIAEVLLNCQEAYQEALNMFQEIFQKRKEILGLNDNDTLRTRSAIALVLAKQGKDEEAFNIYQEVFQKQKEILGPNHSDTLDIQFCMSKILERQGKYEEALNINALILEKRKEILGANDLVVLRAQENIAKVLNSQGKYEEALKIYEDVFKKRKKIFGIKDSATLSTLHNIAVVLCSKKKYYKALNTFQVVFDIQKKVLKQNHPATLTTQYNIANVLFNQHRWFAAFKAYKEVLNQTKAIFGPNHADVLDIVEKMKIINSTLKLDGYEESKILHHQQKNINIAASSGDIQTVQRLLKDGADVNDKDIDGRTPLHYAVSNGHINVVNILLKSGADVTQVTNKGNTPLHTATSKDNRDIIEILLQHISCDKLNERDFINAKTTFGGTTSLHVAAKNGFLEVVKSLLKHGATYNITNNEGKTPLNLSKNHDIISLLKLVEELFEDAKEGNVEIINKLKALKLNDFLAVTNSRNNQGNTLLQITTVNKHKNITDKLLLITKPEFTRC